MTNAIDFKRALPRLEQGKAPDPELVREVFHAVFEGTWSPTQIAAFAVALRIKGETPEVIAAAAGALRAHMIPVDHDFDVVLDTCGTGGDGCGSLNLSTGAAILAAAAGVPVAKHGNRAVSSRSGSADVLRALGIAIDVPASSAADVMRQAGITFLFAPVHHPAMRFVAPARQELGVRTIFNCMGPLANPARATHQLLGAYDDSLRPVLAGTLRELGVKRAWVLRSEEGMDEVSPFAPTRVTVLENGELFERTVSPRDFGLGLSAPGATDGGSPDDNAAILRAVLEGQKHASRDAFVLNAAAALCVAEGLDPIPARERIESAIESGAARETLEKWRDASNQAPK